MFHLSLYAFICSGTAARTMTDMPAVQDGAITLVNQHPIFPTPVKLMLAYGFGQTDLTDLAIVTPKLRTINIPHIRPLDVATAPTTRPPIFNSKRHPLNLNAIDENAMQFSCTTGTDTNVYYAAAWYGDGMLTVPPGEVISVPFTAAVAGAAGAWQNGVITLSQSLPAGKYAVVGMDIYGANLVFARLVFPTQTWRPGCLAGKVASFINAPCFREGEMGTWGIFDSFAQPSLDCYGTGTVSTQTGIIDVVRIA